MTSPQSLRAAAAALERIAGDVTGRFDRVGAASGPDTWLGPAADTFAVGLARARSSLSWVAGDLHDTAARLRVRAAHLEQQAEEAASG